jgi:hypothetical protein
VEILFDVSHLVACIKDNFLSPSSPATPRKRIAIMGTIQFASAINTVISQLQVAVSLLSSSL